MSTAEKTDRRNAGGGWNRKTREEHILEGTYRADRHGKLGPALLDYPKPPGRIVQTAAEALRWARSEADDRAVRNGCRFNERLAEHAADFFPRFLCHSKGRWFGQPFDLAPWQRDEVIFPLFGWVTAEGKRRFRRSYIEIPKKNGKSTLAAGIGLYMLTADEEAGAEVYSLGADKDQARIVHGEAIHMVEASPELGAVLKINRSTSVISYAATMSSYKAMSSAPRGKHGFNIHAGVIDELHQWYGDELWETIKYGYRAREQPLQLVITNAGDDIESVCYRQRDKAIGVLNGSLQDDAFFALLYSVERAEAEAEIAAVKDGATVLPVAEKCNPALGNIIRAEDLLQDIKDAIQTPSELPNLLRLTYGVWCQSNTPWLSAADWAQCRADFTEDDLAGAECHAGLDLSKTEDMTALALMFRDPENEDLYRQLVRFYLPEETVEKHRHLIDYDAWVKAGVLRLTPGNVIDYAFVRQDINEAAEKYQIKTLCYDRAYAAETAQWLQEQHPEIELIEFPQVITQFCGPTAEYERLVLSHRLLHNGNPVLTWQAGHVSVKIDVNNNKRPVKPPSADVRKIDGMVAGIMALSRAMIDDPGCAYDRRVAEGQEAILSW